MRVFAISDVHIDYAENRKWLFGLSRADYTNDILLLAGDITHLESLFAESLTFLNQIFHHVLFVPGNHDLWVEEKGAEYSIEKLDRLLTTCQEIGIRTKPAQIGNTRFIPLYAWYDYSFGQPSPSLMSLWNDFQKCRWPDHLGSATSITDHFIGMNDSVDLSPADRQITFSHFLPRIDLMPSYIPHAKRIIYPVLGTDKLENLIQAINPDVHIYGHSHVNHSKVIHNTRYINNAFGYPHEKSICDKSLACLFTLKP